MNLEAASCLAADEVGADDQVVEDLTTAALHNGKLLNLVHGGHSLVIALQFHILQLLHAFLDLLASLGEAIILSSCLGLHCESFHPKIVKFIHGRELHSISTSRMEVDPQEGPLALKRVRNTFDCADMNWDPSRRRVRNQHSMALHVNENFALLHI